MQEKFVVKLTSGQNVSRHKDELYIMPMGWKLLTGIAHTTAEKAKDEIATYMQKHPMETTIYKVDSYFVQDNIW